MSTTRPDVPKMPRTLDSEEIAALLDSAGVARKLSVPESWVRSRTRARTPASERIPCIRLGRYCRFHWPTVAAWLQSRGQ
jgi:hypothetical protein